MRSIAKNYTLANLDDVIDVSQRLSTKDQEEALATYGTPAEDYLPAHCDLRNTWVIFDDAGNNYGLCGVMPSGVPRLGQCWMVSTPDLYKNMRTFLKQSKHCFQDVTVGYDIVFNLVSVQNHEDLRWMKWMGFKFLRVCNQWGYDGRDYYEFVAITRKS